MRYALLGLWVCLVLNWSVAEAAEKEVVAVMSLNELDALSKRVALMQEENRILQETVKTRKAAAEVSMKISSEKDQLITMLEEKVMYTNQLLTLSESEVQKVNKELESAEFWKNVAWGTAGVISLHPAFRWVRGMVRR